MSGVLSTIGMTAYQLAFEISPIFLVNGLAGQIEGGALPIIVLTEASNFVLGLLSGGTYLTLDNFFAHFQPVPGSTLFDQQIATYPFANQTVAANATISQPLQLSYLMRCPARNAAGYLSKLATISNLQQQLTQHASLGGSFTCATPSTIYFGGILVSLRDVSDTQDKQTQNAYQWDFVFPLLTLEQAQGAQNSLMNQLTSQTQIVGQPSFSGGAAGVGGTTGLITPSVIPSAGGLPATAGYGVSGGL